MVRLLTFIVGVSLIAGLAASIASADTVRCTPLIRRDKIVGLCFVVSNTPEGRCRDAGCIFDVHFTLPRPCVFTRIISLPQHWHGAGVPYMPSPMFVATTWPDPQTSPSNPIGLGQSKRFCVGVNARCLSGQEPCIEVQWLTTGAKGEPLDSGVTRCCVPVKG